MFFRRSRVSLIDLVLIFLGLGWLCRRSDAALGSSDEVRSKLAQFRTKLREAFSVWEQAAQPAPAPEPEATEGQA